MKQRWYEESQGMMFQPREDIEFYDYDLVYWVRFMRLLAAACEMSVYAIWQHEWAVCDHEAEYVRWNLPDPCKSNVQLGRVVIAKQQRLADRHRVIMLDRKIARNIKRTMPHVKVLKVLKWKCETWSLTEAVRELLQEGA